MSDDSFIFQDPLSYIRKVILGEIDPKKALQDVLRFQLRFHPFYYRFASELFPEMTQAVLTGLEEFPEESIPMVPIRAFKELDVVLPKQIMRQFADPHAGIQFKSSGTSKMIRSTHHIPFPVVYKQSVRFGFDQAYPSNSLPIISYLPGYRDNEYSSLIYMMEELTKEKDEQEILHQPEALQRRLETLSGPVILFGAAFGLVDFLEQVSGDSSLTHSNSDTTNTDSGYALPDRIVSLPTGSLIIETGGMKTHRREISKSKLYKILSHGFGLPTERIHSEYGMCEMSSQAYAKGSEWFTPPPWLSFQVRHPNSPMKALPPGERGKLALIDLCNLFSCPFILTDDEAEMNEHGDIKIHGRWPGEEARGCNFLIDRD